MALDPLLCMACRDGTRALIGRLIDWFVTHHWLDSRRGWRPDSCRPPHRCCTVQGKKLFTTLTQTHTHTHNYTHNHSCTHTSLYFFIISALRRPNIRNTEKNLVQSISYFKLHRGVLCCVILNRSHFSIHSYESEKKKKKMCQVCASGNDWKWTWCCLFTTTGDSGKCRPFSQLIAFLCDPRQQNKRSSCYYTFSRDW